MVQRNRTIGSPGKSVLMDESVPLDTNVPLDKNEQNTLLQRKQSSTLHDMEDDAGGKEVEDSIHELAVGWEKDLKKLAGLLCTSLCILMLILYFYVFAKLQESERKLLKVPTSLKGVQELSLVLTRYAEEYPLRVLCGHGLSYVFLQSFAIPGTVFFNLLGGALFGMTLGFPLCLVYNTVGSLIMFQLSKHLGKRVVLHYFMKRMQSLRDMLSEHHGEIVLYMIFLRIFPFTPNWFMNAASPHLHINRKQFIMAVFFGLAPYNFLSCKAGLILRELRSKNDIIDTATTIQLIAIAVFGFVALPLLKKHFK